MTDRSAPAGSRRSAGTTSAAWPWRIVVVAMGALLIGVIVASLVALGLTLSVSAVAERTLTQDVAFEDEAEDVHVAVLNLEHEHRSLVLGGRTRAGVAEHAAAVSAVLEELDELASLGISSPGTVEAADLEAMVAAYVADVGDVLEQADIDPHALDEALDIGLVRLDALEQAAASLDAVGTARAADALRGLGQTTAIAATALAGILVAAILVGLALTISAVRVLGELRRLAAAERRANADLKELLRTRSDFIADASHELRTPLTVLRGNAELGTRLAPADCAHVPVLQEIASEAMRMGRLVEELLYLTRHDAGDAMSQPELIELDALAADISARSEALCRGRGVPLEVQLAAAGTGLLDPARIEQAALVLVDNASTHTPPGEAVSLTVEADDAELHIEVGDRGPGIPAAILPHIFDRFRRAQRARGGQEGAGLGLAIARAIAEEHGGTITPTPRPGGGTLMSLRVPRVKAAAGDPA